MCNWGLACREIRDPQHCERFLHATGNPDDDKPIRCKWGMQCRMVDDTRHTAKYSHVKVDQDDS